MYTNKSTAYAQPHHRPFDAESRASVPVNPVTQYFEQMRTIWNIK
jgi:hypothetical protein